MKILVIGNTLGNLDLINDYVAKSKADIVLCNGSIGLFPKSIKSFPKSFYLGRFDEYISQEKKFLVPVYSVRGVHDNLSYCEKLWKKEIEVPNFQLLKDGESVSISNNTEDVIPIKEISIGGIGGSYSPKSLSSTNNKTERYFKAKDINSLKNKKLHILLLHDVIGNISKKEILFSSEFYNLLDSTSPFYCFIGKYNWWACSKLVGMNVVVLPSANRGYFLIDTNDEWNSSATSYDFLDGGGLNGH